MKKILYVLLEDEKKWRADVNRAIAYFGTDNLYAFFYENGMLLSDNSFSEGDLISAYLYRTDSIFEAEKPDEAIVGYIDPYLDTVSNLHETWEGFFPWQS